MLSSARLAQPVRSIVVSNPLASRFLPAVVHSRGYHDESFGFRKPREYALPDCEWAPILPLSYLKY